MSGAIGVVEFVLERTSNETQSISVAMERWSVEQWAFDVDTYLTLRRLMSYICICIYIYIYMEHPFLMFLDHTQRRSTVGRTPLDE